MFQNNVRLTAAWLIRSFGICGWCLATVFSVSQFIDSPTLAFELEEVERNVATCTQPVICTGTAVLQCGNSECTLNEDNCRCQRAIGGARLCCCTKF